MQRRNDSMFGSEELSLRVVDVAAKRALTTDKRVVPIMCVPSRVPAQTVSSVDWIRSRGFNLQRRDAIAALEPSQMLQPPLRPLQVVVVVAVTALLLEW